MHRQKKTSLQPWLIFVATAVALSIIAWLAWSAATHHNVLPGISSAHSDSSVTIGLLDAPESLDIRTESDTAVERALLGNVYETLVSRNNDNALQPGLAKSWKISDDGLTYTFTLRSNVRFSNGDRLDSSDVVWSMQQIVSKKYQGADDLSALKSVTNPDSTTVAITLNHNDPALLRALSGRAGIVYDSEAKTAYKRQAVGSGPFTVGDYSKGSSITLVRNDDYWGTTAATDSITLRYYRDSDSLIAAMRDNKVDMALPDGTDDLSALNDDPTISVTKGTSTSKVMLALNNNADSILSDQQARHVIQSAVDRQSIASQQTDSAGAVAGPFGPLDEGYEDLTATYTYDPAQARSMIAYFAGGASYFGTLDFVVPQRYESLGDTVTSQLEAVGLSVNMEVVDSATATQRIKDGQYTLAIMVTAGDADDAAVYGTADNEFGYDNGTVQQAYAAAMASTNDETYQNNLKLYARTIMDDTAADWLYSRNTVIAARNKVSGYPTNMTDRYLPLHDVVKK